MGSSGGASRLSKLVVLLDTNMLILIASGVNVFEQIEERLAIKPEYVVLKPIVRELESLASEGGAGVGKKARLALEIANKCCRVVDVDSSYSDIDDLIIEYAERHRAAVATNDRDLRKKLRARGIPEIYLREEKMMVEVEGLNV